MAAAAPARSRWFFGPLPDLLLGCNVAYLLVFLVHGAAGGALQAWVPVGMLALLGLLTGTPHYGATLLRVYERGEERRRYAFFAVWATLAVAAAFVAGLHDARVGSFLFTVFLTWSPWHYTGQNYGLALMFLGRRGVKISPREKRLVYASFVLSWVLIFLSQHGAAAGATYTPAAGESGAITFVRLGIPADLRNLLMGLVGVGYLAATGTVAVRLLRRAPARDLLPAALLALSQCVWFALPALARVSGTFQGFGPLAADQATYAFFWVAHAHALQYLWVTTYYATRGQRSGRSRFFAKSVLAGSAIWGLPALLFAPRVLGPVPYDAGLFVMVSAAVNLHHFILDGAIWKLRDGRIARVLVRAPREEAAPPVGPTGAGWFRPVVWVAGGVCAVAFVLGTWEWHYGYRAALEQGDTQRVRVAARRLGWIGRESADLHHDLAGALARDGRIDAALAELRRALEVKPSARSWAAVGHLEENRGDLDAAFEAYERALALDDAFVPALYRSGVMLVELGRPLDARPRLEKALSLQPRNDAIKQALLGLILAQRSDAG